jgi:hypothetical protein
MQLVVGSSLHAMVDEQKGIQQLSDCDSMLSQDKHRLTQEGTLLLTQPVMLPDISKFQTAR